MTTTYTFSLHAPQQRPLGWFGKLLTAMLTLVLFIGGFVISLLMLALGGAILLATMAKLWLAGKTLRQANRKSTVNCSSHIIEGEYQVKQD